MHKCRCGFVLIFLIGLIHNQQVCTRFIFKVGLLPYLRLIITSMKKNTLIKHKEATVICEESGHVNLNYNVLLITLEVNTMVKPTIIVVATKLTLTCTNCDKIGHLVETYHNMKRKVAIVPTATMKSIELVA